MIVKFSGKPGGPGLRFFISNDTIHRFADEWRIIEEDIRLSWARAAKMPRWHRKFKNPLTPERMKELRLKSLAELNGE